MKKINIFLAIDEKELSDEREEIGNFIRDLNDKFEVFDIYFKLITDENSQEIKEEDIKNSELFFIMFYKQAKEKLVKEFNIAYDLFKENQNPKIATYIRKTDDNDESMINFLKHLDEELGHYYNQYENIDTIKLNIILQLKALNLETGNIEIEEGKILINKQEIMTLENIPMIFNNKQLISLKEEYNKLEKEYWEYREKIKKNPEDDDSFNKFEKIKIKKTDIQNSIYELEKNIIELESNFVKVSLKDNLSRRQIYAQKCLEKGDLEEAKKALEFDEIKKDGDRLLALQEERKKELQVIVNELLQRTNVLQLDINNPNRFDEIEKTFQEAMKIDEMGDLNRTSLVKYADYLVRQKQYDKALKIAKRRLEYLDTQTTFEKYNRQNNSLEFIVNLIETYEKLGLIYMQKKDRKNAFHYINKFMKTCESFSKPGGNLSKYFRWYLANSYNYFAALLEEQKDLKNAKKYLNEATMLMSEEFQDNKSGNSILYLELFSRNLANICIKLKEYEQAEEFFTLVVKLEQGIFKYNEEKFTEILGNSYFGLATAYRKNKKYKDAENSYIKALQFENMVKNKNLNNKNEMLIYYGLGVTYAKLGNIEKTNECTNMLLKLKREQKKRQKIKKYNNK